jgi:regulator of replication initiation timing
MASEDIAKQMKASLEECARLREENKRLRSILGISEEKPNASGLQESIPSVFIHFFPMRTAGF